MYVEVRAAISFCDACCTKVNRGLAPRQASEENAVAISQNWDIPVRVYLIARGINRKPGKRAQALYSQEIDNPMEDKVIHIPKLRDRSSCSHSTPWMRTREQFRLQQTPWSPIRDCSTKSYERSNTPSVSCS